MVPLLLTRRALRQLARAKSWWLDQRDKAPEALEEEVEAAYAFIASNPRADAIWKQTLQGPIRRHYLERVRYHLYYRLERERIVILCFWHAARRAPHL